MYRMDMAKSQSDSMPPRGWTADDSTFGARLALVRQRMGWGNVKEAAVNCGVPTESWRTWERDGVEPRRIVEIAATIADRTGCDYGWLLTGPRLREGRVLTTVGERTEGKGAGITIRKFGPTSRPGPNGHPKRTKPDPSTRRPARVRAAYAAS